MTRRHDPERRDRIIDAAIDSIADDGVAGTSHRRVAQRADVPLGSMTYHFTDMDDLLGEALGRFAQAMSARFEARIAATASADEAAAAVVETITGLHEDQRELVLTMELYTLAARKPAFRASTDAWMARSRATLERWFDRETARQLDALIEGLSIHRALDPAPMSRATVADAVDRIIRPADSRAG